MKQNDNIEDLFKEKFENYEAEVSPTVWSNVKTALKGAGIGILFKTLINKIGTNTLVAVVSSAATVVSTILIMNWTGSSDKPVAEKPQPKSNEVPVVINEEPKENLIENPVIIPENKNVENNQSNQKTENIEKKGSVKIKANEVIKDMNKKQVAFISSSTVAGPVPLIVNFENIGNGKINRWDFGDGKKEKNNSNPVHAYDIPGIYTVQLTSTSPDGIVAIDTVNIEVYGNSSLPSQPTVFSPNGDGLNDLFVFQTKDIIEMEATIVNENGKPVYNCSIGCKWDGKDLNGKDVSVGKYFYMIKAKGVDGKKYERKGIINLTR